MTTSTPKDRTDLTVLPAVVPAARPQLILASEGTIASRPGLNPGHECVSLPGKGLDTAAGSVEKTAAITPEDRAA